MLISIYQVLRKENHWESKTSGNQEKKPIDYNASNENKVLKQVLESLQTKADNITIKDGNLRLMSQGQPVGDKVRLNTSGENEIEIRTMVQLCNGDIQIKMTGMILFHWKI